MWLWQDLIIPHPLPTVLMQQCTTLCVYDHWSAPDTVCICAHLPAWDIVSNGRASWCMNILNSILWKHWLGDQLNLRIHVCDWLQCNVMKYLYPSVTNALYQYVHNRRHTSKNGYHYTCETSEEVDISIWNTCHCFSSCTYIGVITGSLTVTNTVHQYLIGWTQKLMMLVYTLLWLLT